MSAPLCRCGHDRRHHGNDRHGRPSCFGSTVCGCSQFREPAPRTDGGPSLGEYLASKGEI